MKVQTLEQKHIEMSRDSRFSSVRTCFWNFVRYHFQNSFNRFGQMFSLIFCAVTVRATINVNNTTTARPKLEQSSVKLQE